MLDLPLFLDELVPLPKDSVGLAVLGCPIKHSISPQLHQSALSDMAETDAKFSNWRYDKIEVPVERLQSALVSLAELGYRGLNLTIPHKVEVLPMIEQIDEGAALIGAVNTLSWENECWKGYNTDGVGFERAVKEAFSVDLSEFEVLVLGAGGASRAAIVQALSMGSPKVGLINRSVERAKDLANILKDKGFSQLPEIITEEQVDSFFDSSQKLLVVNATSLGLSPADPAPVSLPKTRKNIFVYDMIYNPPQTSLLEEAKSLGLPHANGLGMLVGQAAKSLEIWSGANVPISAMEGAAMKLFPTSIS